MIPEQDGSEVWTAVTPPPQPSPRPPRSPPAAAAGPPNTQQTIPKTRRIEWQLIRLHAWRSFGEGHDHSVFQASRTGILRLNQ